MLASPFCRISTRISVILCLGDSIRGVNFIFRCLFLWHTVLFMWNARQGPPPNCIILWPNKSTVWVTLLPSNKWHFCVYFYELFLQVSPCVNYRTETENGAVSHRETHTYAFFTVVCVFPFFFLYLQYFYSAMTPYTFSQLFVFQFESDYFALTIIVSELSLYTFLAIWRLFFSTRGFFSPHQFLMYGANNFTKMPGFNCETFDISTLSCRHWSSLLCNVTVYSCSAPWLQATNTREFQLYFHVIFLCLVVPMFQTLVVRPYVPEHKYLN